MDRDYNKALLLHQSLKGKLTIDGKIGISNSTELSLVYSPGVAEPCKEIFRNPATVYDLTIKGNFVAVVSDGTAVLGLGNIGPEASMPVMEGKAMLFKAFANIDAVPICLDTTDAEKIIETVKILQPTFGGINLEDIASPNCFLIEERLKNELNIPVFHDDQHGTAIVTVAGMINALKLVGKSFSQIKVVVNGAGAAGIAVIKLMIKFGVKNIVLCDSQGAVYKGRPNGMNAIKEEVATWINDQGVAGSLSDVINGADVFIGLSTGGVVTQEMVRSMNPDPIIFAMANPIPEIMPEEAKRAGAKVIGTGRSDFPNQVNNVLAFPGVFRGALDVRATEINETMKIAAVHAIASLVSPDKLSPDYIIPDPFDSRVASCVAAAVARAAIESGVGKEQFLKPLHEHESKVATI